MNRRNFLRLGALSAGGIAFLGSELLIPKRTYFLPPNGGWPGVHQRQIYYHNFATPIIDIQAETETTLTGISGLGEWEFVTVRNIGQHNLRVDGKIILMPGEQRTFSGRAAFIS